MSTVRLTADAKQDLINAANNMFGKRLTEANEFFMDRTELGMKLRDYYINQHNWGPAFMALPAGNQCPVTTASSIRVNRINGWAPAHAIFPLPAGTPVPTRRARNPQTQAITHEPILVTVNDSDWEPIAEQGAAHDKRYKELSTEKAAFMEKIKVFLDRHTTHKAALAEWPQLWELVPTQMRAKHNEVAAPKGPRPAALKSAAEKFDTSDLTGAIVATKMINLVIN